MGMGPEVWDVIFLSSTGILEGGWQFKGTNVKREREKLTPNELFSP